MRAPNRLAEKMERMVEPIVRIARLARQIDLFDREIGNIDGRFGHIRPVLSGAAPVSRPCFRKAWSGTLSLRLRGCSHCQSQWRRRRRFEVLAEATLPPRAVAIATRTLIQERDLIVRTDRSLDQHCGVHAHTPLVSDADLSRILARLRSLRSDLIDPTIAVHHGRIVKRTGDGAIVEFRSVVDALNCAIEVQRAMVERNAGVAPDKRIEFRVGVHLGDVVEESDGDLMGDGVNIAAWLEGIAKPGAICLSEDAYRQVKGRLEVRSGETRALPPQSRTSKGRPASRWSSCRSPISAATRNGQSCELGPWMPRSSLGMTCGRGLVGVARRSGAVRGDSP